MRLHKQVFVLLFAVLACGARAQDYPNRPIRILVPNAPGSSVDTMTRILTTRLGEALGGASIVVEDRDGAGGLIGMDAGRKAAPDGYTLITVSNGSGVIAPLLKKVRPYDTAQDFELIGSFAITPNVLVVNPQLPVNSVKELIDYARAHRATINMASAGIGSQSHLAGALLMTMGNFESLHVPHKGGGPSVGSVAAGQTHWTLTPAPAAMAQVKAGRLRAIGQSLPPPAAPPPGVPALGGNRARLRFQRLGRAHRAQGHAAAGHRAAAGCAGEDALGARGARWPCRPGRRSLPRQYGGIPQVPRAGRGQYRARHEGGAASARVRSFPTGTAIAAAPLSAHFFWRRYGEAAAMAPEAGRQARVHPVVGPGRADSGAVRHLPAARLQLSRGGSFFLHRRIPR